MEKSKKKVWKGEQSKKEKVRKNQGGGIAEKRMMSSCHMWNKKKLRGGTRASVYSVSTEFGG